MTTPFITSRNPIPHYDWNQFLNSFEWVQGEHVAMIGPTGDGKTSLALRLLPLREFVTAFATKPFDDTLDKFVLRYGYKKLERWYPRMSATKYPKRILWPDAKSLHSKGYQRTVFYDALSDIYQQGHWCVYFDELWWMSQILKLQEEVKIFLQQGRAMKLSTFIATQRPAWVPLEIYDQSTHLFFWADNDESNLNRISGIGSFDSHLIRACVSALRRYECLYVNTRDKTMLTFFPPVPS